MPNPRQTGRRATDHPLVFSRGQIVLVTLNTPREKFWGALLELSPAGVSLRGIDLNSLDDFARQVKSGDTVSPGAVFFPMHRVERMELDARNGDIPSLCERFFVKTNHDFSEFVDADSVARSRATASERRS